MCHVLFFLGRKKRVSSQEAKIYNFVRKSDEVMHTVMAAWRTSLSTRRTVGSLQAGGAFSGGAIVTWTRVNGRLVGW